MTGLGVWIVRWLVVINIVAFCLFGVDKWKARRGAWRISEAMLLLSAVLGGSLGALAGMRVFHHKTRHPLFTITVPLLLVLDIALAVWGRVAGWW